MTETIIIKLDASTPLPCVIYNAERNEPCGNPATVAYAYERRDPAPPLLVVWVVQPICADCVAKAAAWLDEHCPTWRRYEGQKKDCSVSYPRLKLLGFQQTELLELFGGRGLY